MSTVRTSHLDSDAESSEVRQTEQTGHAAGGCDGSRNSPDRSDVRSGGASGASGDRSPQPTDSSSPCDKDAFFRDILAQSGSGELRQVEVNVQDGQIILRGRVSSFYQKQMAQESLFPVAIGMRICNQLEVDP
ncbi:BON domain-containing protein [Stieleria sp. ICT_E10.1]|uniref:BON domain-containing protein n=1 Tax=Stieleria sedimenti TaxID=2976331 RepID=UPI00217F8EAE|nr:BON domain-containing protein [Stieleria sedimenti]MCS7466743.1 BON domain-containing protein [Stieleria sedimenti]